ncbi:MAG: pyridoxamine 5-phosphate oxidase [Thermoleophilia bacterium]|nr:pyridoxamine 5-phosphate oxidase [Thermoleophilia bacterium]
MTQGTTERRTTDLDKLADLIEDVHVALFATVRPGGAMHARPMGTVKMQPDGTIIFFTDRESLKVDEIRDDQHVLLNYADPGSSKFVSVSGRAAISYDRALIHDNWSKIMDAWFDGADDPNVAVVVVTVDEAEYWDTPKGGRPVQMLKIATAAFTGRDTKQAEHGVIQG